MTKRAMKTYASLPIQHTLPFAVEVYPPQGEAQGTIIYFHGGGFLCGEASDLPEPYLDLIQAAGYALVACAYPLAPENTLADILDVSEAFLRWFEGQGADSLGVPENYTLFGRSAGAYLALALASRDWSRPEALVSFYGYSQLTDATFRVPSPYYRNFKAVPESLIQTLTQDEPVLSRPLSTGYSLYLYARQSGRWLALLGLDRKGAKALSISDEALAHCPKTFLAAGLEDPDIPVRQSQQLAKKLPQAKSQFIPVREHDFDRTQIEALGLPLYREMLAWLAEN